jgi:hypothetical protein
MKNLALLLLLGLTLSYAQNGQAADVKDCYPNNGFSNTEEVSRIQEGAVEIWDILTGNKQPDENSLKKAALGYANYLKIGLTAASAVPEVGAIFGGMAGVLGFVLPKEESSELKCMRVLLEKLDKILEELGKIQKSLDHLKDVIESQQVLRTYIDQRNKIMADKAAIQTFLNDKEKRNEAVNACQNDSPMATRAFMRDIILGNQFAGNFIPALLVTASCDDLKYVQLTTMIISDLMLSVSVQEACDQVLNASMTSSQNNYKTSAKEISEVSLALLAARFDMQKQCLAKDILKKPAEQSDLVCGKGDIGKDLQVKFEKKYPLIKPQVSGVCVENEPRNENCYETFPEKQVQPFCQMMSYPPLLDMGQNYATIPVPTNTTQAALALMEMEKNAKTTGACKDPSQACWPCKAADPVAKSCHLYLQPGINRSKNRSLMAMAAEAAKQAKLAGPEAAEKAALEAAEKLAAILGFFG